MSFTFAVGSQLGSAFPVGLSLAPCPLALEMWEALPSF